MFTIAHHTDQDIVEIKNTSSGCFAKVYLKCGGSLQELMLHNQQIVADLDPLRYESTYASAILFPFANRIKDGQFHFEGQHFQLDINNKTENNALHGLVYNKKFIIKSQSASEDAAQLILRYDYDKPEFGFPFPFGIQLKYTFTTSGFDCNVLVENKSENSFPFTVGWHPYFFSKDLNKSHIDFKSRFKLQMGERHIGIDLKEIAPTESLSLKTKSLDDCWQLDDETVVFKTPKYKLSLASSEPNSFLQIYTPPVKNSVAIEPTTGVSNSFNNKIGLRVLKPRELFEITWSVNIHSN